MTHQTRSPSKPVRLTDTHRLTWTIRPAGSDDTGDGWRPTHLMDRVLDHLSGQTDPVGRNEIARAIKGKREYVLRAIDCLITDGRLTEQPGPNRARLISVVPGSQ